jgi:hypothetical protein
VLGKLALFFPKRVASSRGRLFERAASSCEIVGDEMGNVSGDVFSRWLHSSWRLLLEAEERLLTIIQIGHHFLVPLFVLIVRMFKKCSESLLHGITMLKI